MRRLLSALDNQPDDTKIALACAEELLEIEWVALHSCHYKDVTPETRRAFLAAALAKALCQSIMAQLGTPAVMKESLETAIQTLDNALIMVGRARSDNLLDDFVEALETSIGRAEPSPRAKAFRIEAPPAMSLQFPVTRLEKPMSLSAFTKHLKDPCTPFIVHGCLDHWPALSDRPWMDLGYFETLVRRHRIVPVELGSRYTDEEWSQKLMPFGRFLDEHILASGTYGDRNDIEINPGYLAQHDLLAQVPRIRRDIAVPDYVYAAAAVSSDPDAGDFSNADPILNFWFGPADTVSPAHTDPYHNLFAQVVGYKYLRLFAPSETAMLYPESGIMSNTSSVDVENPDLDRFPDFARAKYLEALVGPGDLLFIPVGWWHHVRSLTVSCSISFWFGS